MHSKENKGSNIANCHMHAAEQLAEPPGPQKAKIRQGISATLKPHVTAVVASLTVPARVGACAPPCRHVRTSRR
jgi:hypothetical protein